MKIATIVGARPQFIKAAPVSRAMRAAGVAEFLIHTGQHYDALMSQVFFDEMDLPAPDLNLEVGSGPHGWQTAQMLHRLEEALTAVRPDWVLVYGDTNSTLAGALAAVKLGIPVAHVEAGLRAFNRAMPEESNRVLTDHAADLRFCPTQAAMANLAREGLGAGSFLVGDTMADAVRQYAGLSEQRSGALRRLGLTPGRYLLATVHRPVNTDSPDNLRGILAALEELGEPVVFPVHPRTRRCMAALEGLTPGANLRLIEPVGYLEMLALEKHARVILTDSGGVQKEACLLGVPCVTLRCETEWVETVASGWNALAGTDQERIVACARAARPPGESPLSLFGDGYAAEKIARSLLGAGAASGGC